ncbi:MAG: DUF5615 family PIN-like protein [Candidatus Riflebacteria bacterium]|nr:DUF5615 family PIN-like protein [Candidatus Riflebacteria bacterium]
MGKSDVEVAQASQVEGRVVFTLDVGFADLRKFPPGRHPGVFLFRPRTLGYRAVSQRSTSVLPWAWIPACFQLPRARKMFWDASAATTSSSRPGRKSPTANPSASVSKSWASSRSAPSNLGPAPCLWASSGARLQS